MTETTGGCSCGHENDGVPQLDARTIPHEVRHAAILGAIGALTVGSALDLTAPHDPQPLLAQIAEQEQGTIDVAYLVRGPEAWTLRLTRAR